MKKFNPVALIVIAVVMIIGLVGGFIIFNIVHFVVNPSSIGIRSVDVSTKVISISGGFASSATWSAGYKTQYSNGSLYIKIIGSGINYSDLSGDISLSIPNNYNDIKAVYLVGAPESEVMIWPTNNTTKIPKIDNLDNQAMLETLLQAPNQDTIAKTEETIKAFMALPNLTFTDVTVQKNPSNFSVGKVTVIGDGATRMDTPPEWNRPVYLLQQKEYINNQCAVYEYEVSAETNQVIEVHVKALNIDSSKCVIYGSMETPLKSKAEIEKIAMDFLVRNITNFEQIKSQFVYTSSKQESTNPASNEWKWQDTNSKLPEGMSGDIPTIRIIISSGGKLIYYFNSSEALNFIFRYGVGSKNELNTFSRTYTKDMVMDSPVTVNLKLTDKEIVDVYKKINDLKLFDIKKETTETNARVTPCSSYYLKVQSSYPQKGLAWDNCQGKINDKLQEFTDYIIKIIESKEEYKALPTPKGGYL